jgi:hypothetical protein
MPALDAAVSWRRSQLKPCSSTSAQSMIAWHVWNRSANCPSPTDCWNIASYCIGAMSPMISLARRMCAISFAAPRFMLIFESSSTIESSQRPFGIPRFLPCERSTPAVLENSLLESLSLNAPRSRSENSQSGSCGGVFFIIMKRGEIALRIVGSLAMSRRERLRALRATYSAWMPSRCAVAAASSALDSSWNSASMTVRIAMAPITITSAMPLSRRRRRRRRVAEGEREAARAIVQDPFLIAGSRT